MANVNCYPSVPIKPDQPVNSQYIQKILDENVGLIHAIIEKQQQNQEAEDLLKSLHKNLIYLATIADQTTSAGNTSNSTPTQPHQYIYPQPNITHSGQPNQNFHSTNSQPMQTTPYVTQPSMMISQSGVIESSEKKSQPLVEEAIYKEQNLKQESNPPISVDMDREVDKCPPIRECHQQLIGHKVVDMNKECPVSQNTEITKELTPSQSVGSAEYMQKYEDSIATTSSHMQVSTIKTDMPPPSQPIGGIHQEKTPMQPSYPTNQRIMYPGVAPNYNQYNPHIEQNSKFYPQNVYQQSPYNYQGMYNPYQPVAAPPTTPNHYNQHMMNSPMYPQYPYYQQPGMEQLPPGAKDPSLPPQQMHPGSTMSQPMYPPNTMYTSQNPMPPHPPISMSQSNKSLSNMVEAGSASNIQNVSE